MSYILYILAIRTYSLAIRIASLRNEKARKFLKGRRKPIILPKTGKKEKTVWIHCASLGEFEQGRPLIEEIKQKWPNIRIVLSFYSPSGYEVRQNYATADVVCYLPLDLPAPVSKFLDSINPDVAILVKYEFWPVILKQLNKRAIPVLSVSSKFRSDQIFFKWYGGMFRKSLNTIDTFFTQDPQSKGLLDKWKIKGKVIVAGDTRFDRVAKVAEENREVPGLDRFRGKRDSEDIRVMVVGSFWDEDLEVLIPFIQENRGKIKFILAPHEISQKTLEKLQRDLGRNVGFYSRNDEYELEKLEVLIIDSVGLLSQLYRYGNYAWVGGAYGQGLHNILEPACFGLPVFFGDKNFKKFNEAVELIELGGAFAIRDFNELEAKFAPFRDENHCKAVSEAIKEYIASHRGATNTIMNKVQELLIRS